MANGIWFSPEHSLEILHQDEVWVPSDGTPLLISKMDIGHKRNLLRYLERKSIILAQGCALAQQKSIMDIPEDTLGWLHTTPLVARLILDVGAADGVLFP